MSSKLPMPPHIWSSGTSVLQGYTPPTAYYDELLDEAGQLRPQWRPTARALADMGVEGFRARAE